MIGSHPHVLQGIRQQLVKLLDGLVAEGCMTRARAREAARMFLRDNALDCYKAVRGYL